MSSPLDFPQMYQKPAYNILLSTLESLQLSPLVWSHGRNGSDDLAAQESPASQRKAEVTRYVSTIIKSPLSWIDDDDQKETLWELASRRISERCGRTAMGDMVRKWPFEAPDGVEPHGHFELVIREPALTGDSLGFKTWGSSYVLARHLPRLKATVLSKLLDEPLRGKAPSVVELGSGTGLLGVAAAALWKVHVALSDLPAIVGNLRSNADRNRETVEARGGSLSVGPLTWGGGQDEVDEDLFGKPHQFEIVLAADPMYDDNHPALLASAISDHLALGSESRAVVMVPQRDATTVGLLASFKQAMLGLEMPLFCDEEDELAGQDDWDGDDEAGNVRCWLGIFSHEGEKRGGVLASPDCLVDAESVSDVATSAPNREQ
ncbi:uncharacterized protein UV8b_05685 [Ustilaginoidea virens]|uniref:Uncharacterized protein n=1 Tax=Ustilaginoidea virens TaxID=1159556 RepID=A0A8E5MJB5_USTVR|nr:uncharacterized protein UV8b_05685 [Ustilaginoidea virens]QUC21442.1 hypothetical protein UV8b_05685 [Ustilaginoidea virens]